MKLNLNEKQARFQRDDLPHRLGHTASNLARVRSFCNAAYKDVETRNLRSLHLD